MRVLRSFGRYVSAFGLAAGAIGAATADSNAPITAVVSSRANAWVSDQSQSTIGIRLTQTWAACGLFDKAHKLVRVFTRYRATATTGEYLRGGTSDLHCGSERWGYRHILRNHRTEWEQKAALERQNWRDLADYAIENALRDPDRVKYRSDNDTFCFQRLFYLLNRKTGRPAGTMTVSVVVAQDSKNIITAFPGPCR
jgi:hypothetical protein